MCNFPTKAVKETLAKPGGPTVGRWYPTESDVQLPKSQINFFRNKVTEEASESATTIQHCACPERDEKVDICLPCQARWTEHIWDHPQASLPSSPHSTAWCQLPHNLWCWPCLGVYFWGKPNWVLLLLLLTHGWDITLDKWLAFHAFREYWRYHTTQDHFKIANFFI